MRAAGQRLQFEPGGFLAHRIDDAVLGLGRLAALVVDMHLLAARTGLLGERRLDHAFLHIGYADHQRPVDLLGAAAREALGEIGRAARRARHQQYAAGILVEPVHEARARLVLAFDIGVEQAVDMVERVGPALRRKARWLVDHQRALGLLDQHGLGLLDLGGLELALGLGLLVRRIAARGHANLLSLGQPVVGLHPLAVDAHLPGARPFADRAETDLRQVPLEPAIDANPVIVGVHGEAAYFVGGFHPAILITPSPTISPVMPMAIDRTP